MQTNSISIGLLLTEARADKENAAKAKGFDPVTFAVQSKKDLDGWGSWLDKKGVHRSKVFVGVTGWVLCFEVGEVPRETQSEAMLHL